MELCSNCGNRPALYAPKHFPKPLFCRDCSSLPVSPDLVFRVPAAPSAPLPEIYDLKEDQLRQVTQKDIFQLQALAGGYQSLRQLVQNELSPANACQMIKKIITTTDNHFQSYEESADVTRS